MTFKTCPNCDLGNHDYCLHDPIVNNYCTCVTCGNPAHHTSFSLEDEISILND